MADLVNRWYLEGTAAGNIGDYYDNRDHRHSLLNLKRYPQVKPVAYTAEEHDRKEDFGGAHKIVPHLTLGNSSTSGPPEGTGSNARSRYYTSAKGMDFLYQQYRQNNLYVYPSHRDHVAGHNGRGGYGDLYPTLTPYLIISSGSSYNDLPFLNACFATLAAFPPDVKDKLKKTGLIMPTLQRIFRQSNVNVQSRNKYLSPIAHPSVFLKENLNPIAMVHAAHKMRLHSIPPLVQLEVIEEQEAVNGRDYFEASLTPKLADTPCVIARIHRRYARTLRLVVSAEGSFDVHQRPLSFHWILLRGDKKKVRIHPRQGGSQAELEIDYQPRQVITTGQGMASNRVDIGLFADNGEQLSAPGFVTVYTLDNEFRNYDKQGRILEIYYAAGDRVLSYPPRDSEQWVQLMGRFVDDPDELGYRLLKKRIPREHRGLLRQAHADLVQLSNATDLTPTPGQEQAQPISPQQILNRKRPGSGVTPRRILTGAFAKVASSPHLYLKNQSQIDHLAEAASPERARAFHAARIRMLELGLLRSKSAGKFDLDSVVAGKGLPDKAMSPYEKNQLQAFNLTIIQQVLFPNFFAGRPFKTRINAVDQRLTSRKLWRDAYHYDSAVRVTGWTRFHDQGPIEHFTDEGLRIDKSDALGRPVEASEVHYQGGPHRMLLTKDGNRFKWTYASTADRKGIRESLPGTARSRGRSAESFRDRVRLLQSIGGKGSP